MTLAPLLQRRALLPIALLTLTALTSACGLFDRDVSRNGLDVTYTEDFTLPLPTIDSSVLCPAGQDCSQAAVMAQMDRPLNPIELDVELDVVSLTGRQELSQYAGRFRSITISKIEYSVKDNGLTFDLPPTMIHLAPKGITSAAASGAALLATLPAVTAGMSVELGQATINEAESARLSALLQSLQLTAIASNMPVVKQGQLFPPSGKATLSITLYVTFVANPTDAITQ